MIDDPLPPDTLTRLEKFLAGTGESPLSGATPERLGRLAVMYRLITSQQLQECLAQQEAQAGRGETPQSLGQMLVRRGVINEKTLDGLLRLQASGAGPIPQLKRYEVQHRMGEGALAVVYQAFDRELGRPVALKVLKETPSFNEIACQRFQIEAHALARMAHPNVVGVYDFAEEAGHRYLVMELVTGLSFRRFLEGSAGETRRLLEILEGVAEGVQHAHEHGVVHRDLKPENILVADSGAPKVADFGLARLAGSELSLTATGTRQGTPHYMAPEQVDSRRGDVTPQADVYALGAILYEILSGHPPFSGESLTEVFSKLLSEDPVPPRKINPRIHADLETMALKALEKDPSKRYRTARAFAEDLRRYLSGEAILARPVSMPYRCYRWVRRTPFVGGLGLGAVFALVAAVGFWISNVREARRSEVEREGALTTIQQMARASLAGSLEFRRVGANDQMTQFLAPLEAAYRQTATLLPHAAEPDYLIGRYYRALMRDDDALRFQENALRKDPSHAAALYERIVLVSRRYGPQLRLERQQMAALDRKEVTAAATQTIEVPTFEETEHARPELLSIRERLLRDCETLERLIQEGRGKAFSTTSLSEANALAARGILAYQRGKLDQTIFLLTEATTRNPFLEEAWEALAHAAMDRRAENPEEREQQWLEAEKFFTDGLSRDRGYVPHLMHRADLRLIRGDDRMSRGQSPLSDFAGALEDLAEALQLRKGNGSALRGRAEVRSARGVYRMSRGEDPLMDFSAAEEDLDEAISLSPAHVACFRRRGVVRLHRGLYRMQRGDDPLEDFNAAEKDLKEAAGSAENDAVAWDWLGCLRIHRATFRMVRGEDPLDEFAEGERNLSEAIRLYCAYPNAWRNRGHVKMLRGILRMNRGEDPLPEFMAAEEDLCEALRCAQKNWKQWLASEFLPPWTYRGKLRTERAIFLARSAKESLPEYAAGEEDLNCALKLNPADAEAWVARGRLRLYRALVLESQGGKSDAAKEFAAAAKDLGEAVRLNPLLKERVENDRAAACSKAEDLREK